MRIHIMQPGTMIAARPGIVFIVLSLFVLLIPCLLTPWWYKTAKRMEKKVDLNSHSLRSLMISEIDITARLLHPLSSSATVLARLMNSSLDRNQLSFFDIETRVAASLFQAFSTIPLISQISFIGLDGLFFSYYIDNNQILAMYCNSSLSSVGGNRRKQTWYIQPVDRDTGILYGEPIISTPLNINFTLLEEVLHSTDAIASKGSGWIQTRDSLFINTANINGRAAVSIGCPVESITNFFTGMNLSLHGATLSMATIDGEVLLEGLPNAHMKFANNLISFQSKKIVGRNMHISDTTHITCVSTSADSYSILNIEDIEYIVYCSPLELVGMKSVYALALPRKGVTSFVHRTSKLALSLLILLMVIEGIAVFIFVQLMVRSAKREVHLCAALIKQMEATQQAERKSMNKSTAYASASHDVRAFLAAITGLIEISYPDAPPGSELETNLRQMEGIVKDLISLLNTVLDQSKIDAGKMQLEEEPFDLGQLLEDVVDSFHARAVSKGVEVMLDLFDGSVNKFSHVKGDEGKLKQVLINLLSNAIKFTSKGHVTVRAWVRKPSLQTSIIASNRDGFLQHLSCLFYKNKKAETDLAAVNSVKNNPNCMEYVLEVDDTGKGIPKEKQESVFENYVQVKDGEGGTGLGLGIVQSLVRLMGGDIKIVDKPIGEKGTCFRFNIFLTVEEAQCVDNTKTDIEMGLDSTLYDRGLTVVSPRPNLTMIRTNSPRLTSFLSPKVESSLVVLIGNQERRRISQKYLEHLGIGAVIVDGSQSLQPTLRKIKIRLGHSPHGSLRKLEMSFRSDSARTKDVPLSAMEGTDQRVQSGRRRGGGGPSFVLLVIDATAGPILELLRVVNEFRRDIHGRCKVVWLDNPTSRSINVNDPEQEEMIDPSDEIVTKPLHGSRLTQIIKYLPEFGGTYSPSVSARPRREKGPSCSPHAKHSRRRHLSQQQSESQEEDSTSGSGNYSGKDVYSTAPVQTHGKLPSCGYKTTQTEIEEVFDEPEDAKPLTGKRFLVAEDNHVLRKVASITLTNLGAIVQLCENGEEALQLVLNGLKEQTQHVGRPMMPYDYILMDCEMPIMNGFDATKQIREEEKYYGVQIPIIALTAYDSGEQVESTILAGMDVHLTKPLKKENLLEAIRYIDSKYRYI